LATLAIASTMGISKYSVSITSLESSSNGVVSSVVVSSAVVSTKDSVIEESWGKCDDSKVVAQWPVA